MRRFWTLLPIVAAALTVLWMTNIASRSALEIARESWDARKFTGYHAVIQYYDGNQNCTHDLVVEGEEVTSAQLSGTCIPLIEGIEHPTISEVMDYLEAEQARFDEEGDCNDGFSHRQMAITGRYDSEFGYPRSLSIGPMYLPGSSDVACPSARVNWISISVVSFTPS
jgi:hypothetical protein